MIFIGDFSCGANDVFDSEKIRRIFNKKSIVVNLEGPILNSLNAYSVETILFNSEKFFESFSNVDSLTVNLANNHIMDKGLDGLLQTKKYLENREIIYLGAGKDRAAAAEPRSIMINEESSVLLLSFGWSVIQCETADLGKPGVNPLVKHYVINSVIEEKKKNPDDKIIVMFHWNYELEKYPQPRHRELAKRLIDIGVDLIIGHHPHKVNGIEIYKGKPIVYSLGNWFIPHNYFWNGRLSYPEESNIQLAFEWDIVNNKYVNHWFDFDPVSNQINYLESKNLDEDKRIKELTPFSDMDKNTYEKWFKKNRVKKKGLPIYKWDDSIRTIKLKNKWINIRDILIKFLLKTGLK